MSGKQRCDWEHGNRESTAVERSGKAEHGRREEWRARNVRRTAAWQIGCEQVDGRSSVHAYKQALGACNPHEADRLHERDAVALLHDHVANTARTRIFRGIGRLRKGTEKGSVSPRNRGRRGTARMDR